MRLNFLAECILIGWPKCVYRGFVTLQSENLARIQVQIISHNRDQKMNITQKCDEMPILAFKQMTLRGMLAAALIKQVPPSVHYATFQTPSRAWGIPDQHRHGELQHSSINSGPHLGTWEKDITNHTDEVPGNVLNVLCWYDVGHLEQSNTHWGGAGGRCHWVPHMQSDDEAAVTAIDASSSRILALGLNPNSSRWMHQKNTGERSWTGGGTHEDQHLWWFQMENTKKMYTKRAM